MNAKKEAQAKQTRQKIVTAAVRLFARKGYHKTTITGLAQAIGLTSGAIFHHFASKELLLEAVVDWLARGMKVYSSFAEQAESGSIEAVREILLIMCDHFRRNPEATICLAALATEFAGSSQPMEMRLKETYEVFVNAFARLLANHPKVRDPRAAAVAFVGSVQGIAIQGLLRTGEETIDQLAEAFLGLMMEW
ncbi:MAG: TetR/AcrR family transcriptional regulator [Desulforhabdus sp.]|nr:TetR/AcrR family transcriptional regulator [Desulforhabdus sp.]